MSFDSDEDFQKEIFRRLRILVSKGYEIEFIYDQFSENIALKHIGNGPDIFMFPNGCIGKSSTGEIITLTSGQDDVTRIYNDCNKDKVRFDSWVNTVQAPSNSKRFLRDLLRLIFHSPII